MEQQSLLIGLGGTGSRVVNNVTKLLTKNGKTFNDNLGRSAARCLIRTKTTMTHNEKQNANPCFSDQQTAENSTVF